MNAGVKDRAAICLESSLEIAKKTGYNGTSVFDVPFEKLKRPCLHAFLGKIKGIALTGSAHNGIM